MASRNGAGMVSLADGDHHDLDPLMMVMTQAFGTRYGEAWTRSQCAGILPMKGIDLVFACDKLEGPVGFALARSVADESELLLLAVIPDYQRRGIGQQLLGEFLNRARKAGAARVHLEVRDGNPALEMYRAAGFVQVGRRKLYYKGADGQRFDALTFAREV